MAWCLFPGLLGCPCLPRLVCICSSRVCMRMLLLRRSPVSARVFVSGGFRVCACVKICICRASGDRLVNLLRTRSKPSKRRLRVCVCCEPVLLRYDGSMFSACTDSQYAGKVQDMAGIGAGGACTAAFLRTLVGRHDHFGRRVIPDGL